MAGVVGSVAGDPHRRQHGLADAAGVRGVLDPLVRYVDGVGIIAALHGQVSPDLSGRGGESDLDLTPGEVVGPDEVANLVRVVGRVLAFAGAACEEGQRGVGGLLVELGADDRGGDPELRSAVGDGGGVGGADQVQGGGPVEQPACGLDIGAGCGVGIQPIHQQCARLVVRALAVRDQLVNQIGQFQHFLDAGQCVRGPQCARVVVDRGRGQVRLRAPGVSGGGHDAAQLVAQPLQATFEAGLCILPVQCQPSHRLRVIAGADPALNLGGDHFVGNPQVRQLLQRVLGQVVQVQQDRHIGQPQAGHRAVDPVNQAMLEAAAPGARPMVTTGAGQCPRRLPALRGVDGARGPTPLHRRRATRRSRHGLRPPAAAGRGRGSSAR